MYNCKLRHPINLYFGIQVADMNATTSTKFMQWWAHKIAQKVFDKENELSKQNYDHEVRCTKLYVVNLGLLKTTAYEGKHKIQDHLEKTFYKVEGQQYIGKPVFRISLVDWNGKMKIVDQNILLPISTNTEAS